MIYRSNILFITANWVSGTDYKGKAEPSTTRLHFKSGTRGKSPIDFVQAPFSKIAAEKIDPRFFLFTDNKGTRYIINACAIDFDKVSDLQDSFHERMGRLPATRVPILGGSDYYIMFHTEAGRFKEAVEQYRAGTTLNAAVESAEADVTGAGRPGPRSDNNPTYVAAKAG